MATKASVTILVVLASAGSVTAQEPKASLQAAGDDPHATVSCQTADRFYWACRATSEAPERQGIGAAAAKLAACLQASKDSGALKSEVTLPIRFKGLTPQQVVGSVDCPYDPAEPVDLPGGKSVLLKKPSGEDMAKNLPARAADQRVGGSAGIECQAIKNKYKNCRILREFPLGFGFGGAAVRLAALVDLKATDKDDQPIEGRYFRFSVVIELMK